MTAALLRAAAVGALVLTATPCFAQARGGIYTVTGNDPARGTYTGRVELRWTGSEYAFLREVEFATFRPQGRPVSTIWTGVAHDSAGGGLTVDLSLDRMGWISEVVGVGRRAAADGAPMPIHGIFSPALGGGYVGQGAPFADPTEAWAFLSPSGARPFWEPDREVRPSHSAPAPWVKTLLFWIFASYHQTAWVHPYVGRPEFLAAIHSFVFDRTDFALHRARPDLLRVIGRLVDPLALEEARIKADAFGKRLATKIDAADDEIPTRYTEPGSNVVTRRSGSGFAPDGDGCLWNGVYAYSQALRFKVTSDPRARANIERTVEALRIQMDITGSSTEFARTLRPATGQPSGSWQAGTGPYAQLEWHAGGNNDMFKGLLWGGLALADGLPASHPLRASYAQLLGALADNHPVATHGRLGVNGNGLMANGVVAALTGDRGRRDRYVRLARNPFGLLYDISGLNGGIHWQGIADWSGTHLNVSSYIVQIRLADLLNQTLFGAVERIGLRASARRLAPIRRTIHTLAAAGLGRVSWLSPLDASDGVWALREVPYPRPALKEFIALRADAAADPYPSLPWKNDWTTNRGRSHLIVARPYFEQALSNYLWKDDPFPKVDEKASNGPDSNPIDIVFAYWLGRAYGVIGPQD